MKHTHVNNSFLHFLFITAFALSLPSSLSANFKILGGWWGRQEHSDWRNNIMSQINTYYAPGKIFDKKKDSVFGDAIKGWIKTLAIQIRHTDGPWRGQTENMRYEQYEQCEVPSKGPVSKVMRVTGKWDLHHRPTFRPTWRLREKYRGLIMFQAKISQDLDIILDCIPSGFPINTQALQVRKNRTQPAYFINLGYNHNRASRIQRFGVQKLNLGVKVPSADWTDYWVFFNNGHIQVGTGTIPGQSKLLDWKDSQPVPTQYFTFSQWEDDLYIRNIRSLLYDHRRYIAQANHKNEIKANVQARVQPWSKQQGRNGAFWANITKMLDEDQGPDYPVPYWDDRNKFPEKGKGIILFQAKVFYPNGVGQLDIHLAPSPRVDISRSNLPGYLITIGGQNNKTSTVYRPDVGKGYGPLLFHSGSTQPNTKIYKEEYATRTNPGNWNWYWLYYNNGHIIWGRGSKPGKNIGFEVTDTNPHKDIEYFCLSNYGNTIEFADITVKPASEMDMTLIQGAQALEKSVNEQIAHVKQIAEARRSANQTVSNEEYNISIKPIMESLENKRLTMDESQSYNFKQLILLLLSTRGIADVPDRKTFVSNLQEQASIEIDFTSRAQSLFEDVGGVFLLQSTNPTRQNFFARLAQLLESEGDRTAEVITELNEKIILPFKKSLVSDSERDVLDRISELVGKQTATQNSFARHLTDLQQSTPGLFAYVQGIQNLLDKRGSKTISFESGDASLALTEFEYVADSRSLLKPAERDQIRNMVSALQWDQSFALYAPRLKEIEEKLVAEYPFGTRVASLSKEISYIIGKKLPPTHPRAIRFFERLKLLDAAPGEKTTTDMKQLEKNVYQRMLTGTTITSEQKSFAQEKLRLISQERDTLQKQQESAGYQLTKVQENTNFSARVATLRKLIIAKRKGELAFEVADNDLLIRLLAELVERRIELSTADLAALKQTLNYAHYSKGIYDDPAKKGQVEALYTQASAPIEFATLAPRYVQQAAEMPMYMSENATRKTFFAALNNLLLATGDKSGELLAQLEAQVVKPLLKAPHTSKEKEVLDKLQAFIDKEKQNTYGFSAKLATIETTQPTVKGYLQSLKAVLDDESIIFQNRDYERVIAALTYIVKSREMLDNVAVVQADQLLISLQYRKGFEAYATTLANLRTQLKTPSEFTPRLAYLKTEVGMMLSQPITPDSARPKRLITKLNILLDAPGDKTEAQLKMLESDILAPLFASTLAAADKEAIAKLLETVKTAQETAITRGKAFDIRFTALKEQTKTDSSAYVTGLRDLMIKSRKEEVVVSPEDTQTIVDAFTTLVDERDGLSSVDIKNLRSAINYALYSKAFFGNAQYKQLLTNLYHKAVKPVAFATKLSSYTRLIGEVMLLDNSDPKRSRFFERLGRLSTQLAEATPAQLTSLEETIIKPLQSSPLEAQEASLLTTLQAAIENEREKMKSLAYQFTELEKQVKAAQADTSKDPIDALISWSYNIIQKKNAGTVTFTSEDYPRFIAVLKQTVQNREILTPAQLNQIQTLLLSVQYTSGFEPHTDKIENLKKDLQTPYTFSERVAKYRLQVGQVNALPSDAPDKLTFVTMVSTVMTASGTKSEKELATLESDVVNSIMYGNFTDAQKALLTPLKTMIAKEKEKLQQLPYRLSAADDATTPTDYHIALVKILDDYAADKVIFGPNDPRTFVTTLTEEVELRSALPQADSPLALAIEKAKTTKGFVDNTQLQTELATLQSKVMQPADVLERLNYFTQRISTMAALAADDGDRARFFARMTEIAPLLTQQADDVLSTESTLTLLQNGQTTLEQYLTMQGLSVNEKTALTALHKGVIDALAKVQQLKEKKEAEAQKLQTERRAAEEAARKAAEQQALRGPVATSQIGTARFYRRPVSRRR